MGQQLYAEEEVFRDAINQCDQEIRRHLGWSLREEFTRSLKDYQLHSRIELVQPAVTSLQIGLNAVFRHRGIEPAAVAGLSMGEVAAAHEAGVLNLSDAMRVVCNHTKMMNEQRKLRPSNMAFAYLDIRQLQNFLVLHDPENAISIAVEMSPTITVIAGENEALGRFLAFLKEQGVQCGIVDIGFAFHSLEMSKLEPDFFASLQGLHPIPENVPIYSSVSGKRMKGADFDASYLWQMYTKPALFITQIRSLLMEGFQTFVEFSPHPMLTNSILEIARSAGKKVVVLPTMSHENEQSVVKLTMHALETAKNQRQRDTAGPNSGRGVQV